MERTGMSYKTLRLHLLSVLDKFLFLETNLDEPSAELCGEFITGVENIIEACEEGAEEA